jgi:hypothetical protein
MIRPATHAPGKTGEYAIFGSASGFNGRVSVGAPNLGDIPLNRPAALR